MFTGIVEEIGTVAGVDHGPGRSRLEIACRRVLDDLAIGGSIAVNGVCLTAVAVGPDRFAADAVPETLRCTNLGELTPGSTVNLERPLAAAGRFEGHVVQGHVDAVGEVLAVEGEGDGARLRIALPAPLSAYVVQKGSITVDGVSLTVAAAGDGWFEIAVIPHTLRATVLGDAEPGRRVNLEADVLAKYVERMLSETR
ncbi:MAG: riboflavin synthase [Thermoanaerobaculia bacterium]|nr:riboflavin synthase [Thermoanaerobaculia bacterium]